MSRATVKTYRVTDLLGPISDRFTAQERERELLRRASLTLRPGHRLDIGGAHFIVMKQQRHPLGLRVRDAANGQEVMLTAAEVQAARLLDG